MPPKKTIHKSLSSTPTASQSKPAGTDCCPVCNNGVLDTDTGLKCEDCGHWLHSNCAGFSDEVYTFFANGSHPFFCLNCSPSVVTKLKSITALQKQSEHHNNLLADLLKRITELESAPAHNTLAQLTEKISVLEKERLPSNFNSADLQKAVEYGIAKDRKKSNAVIVNLPEHCDAATTVNSIIKDSPIVQNFIKTFRIGQDNGEKRNRITKVLFTDSNSKREFIRLYNKLKSGNDALKRTFVRNDLMPDELENERLLRAELKNRIANDKTVFHFIRDGKLLSRPHKNRD